MNNYKINDINDKLKLPFELFSIDVIKSRLEELKEADNPISDFYELDKATKKKIKEKGRQRGQKKKNARFFAYIKFLNVNGNKYGLVGGKTNYTSPDLKFNKEYGDSLTCFARKFLSYTDLNWDDTIIIIEHIPTNNEKSDDEMALFIECFLQREFNLFNS